MEAVKPRGSFVNPQEIKKHMEEAMTATVTKMAEPKEVNPPVEEKKEEVSTEENKQQAQLLQMKKAYEEELGIIVTEDDIRDYIFKGRLVKSGIKIIPGYMNGSFQTLNASESCMIDEHMASYRDKGKFTPDGLDNERALTILAHTWKSAQKDGDEPYRSLGETVEARDKQIRVMGAHVIDAASYANTGFNFLLKYGLREKNILKKS